MPCASGWELRSGRAAVFASAAVALAGTAHSFGEGMSPSWAVAGVAVVVVFAGAWAGAARERSFAFLSSAMLALQACLHVAFMMSPGRSGSAGPAGRIRLEQVLSTAHTGAGTAPVTTSHAGMAGMPGGSVSVGQLAVGWRMLAAHAVVALLLAWCLRRGEAALWSLARLPARVVLRLLALLRPPAAVRGLDVTRRRCERHVRRPRGRLLRATLVLRGPPLTA